MTLRRRIKRWRDVLLIATALGVALLCIISFSRNAPVDWKNVVDLIGKIAWPAVVGAAMLLFKEPLAKFVEVIGARASKIGAYQVSIELAALPEAKPWSGPSLDDFGLESSAVVSDSGGAIFRAIADTAQADYITIDLESGAAWLSSRLFIVAALIPRVRPIKRMVFLKGNTKQFVGHASPADVAASLAEQFPWFEQAYLASINVDGKIKTLGRLAPTDAANALRLFRLNGEVRWKLTDPPSGQSAAEWTSVSNSWEHAKWVTAEVLEQWLGTRLNKSKIVRDPSKDGATIAKTLLRHYAEFVGVVDTEERFIRLVDRQRALDQIVRKELDNAS